VTSNNTNSAHAGNEEQSPVNTHHPLTRVLNDYVRELDALDQSVPLMMGVAHVVEKDAKKNLDEFLMQYAEPEDMDASGHPKRWRVPAEHLLPLRPLDKRFTSAHIARKIIPRTFLIALVSQFDAFLGKLIRALFDMQPGWLNASEKSLTYSQILEFEDFASVKAYLIEKEVENIMRESHSYHFEWLEKKCGLPLRKDLAAWPLFIELTERRNLFVHTGGVISSQYLQVCREHKVNFEAPPFSNLYKLGDEHDVTSAYFRQSYSVLYEIGVKLAHVLWRKLKPSELEVADSHLGHICYEVLVSEKYTLAQKLLDFAVVTLKKHSSENYRRMCVVNRAQAYKWAGNETEARQILDAEDWSALSDDFVICVAVLRDQFDKACELIHRAGPNGKIKKADFRHWPVFRKFRESHEFLNIYEKVFGEPFTQIVESNDQSITQDEEISI
jgi:hypothetical protein